MKSRHYLCVVIFAVSSNTYSAQVELLDRGVIGVQFDGQDFEVVENTMSMPGKNYATLSLHFPYAVDEGDSFRAQFYEESGYRGVGVYGGPAWGGHDIGSHWINDHSIFEGWDDLAGSLILDSFGTDPRYVGMLPNYGRIDVQINGVQYQNTFLISVPLPVSFWLFSSALAGLTIFRARA